MEHVIQIAGNGRVDYEIVVDGEMQAIQNSGFFMAEANDVVTITGGLTQATGWLDSPSTNAVNGDTFLVDGKVESITVDADSPTESWIVVNGKAVSESRAKSIINAEAPEEPTEPSGGLFENVPKEAIILTGIILLIAVAE